MEFRILGPLEVARDGTTVTPGGPKARALLAYLVINAQRPVTIDAIAAELWPNTPPNGVSNTIQTYVFQLRQLLEPGRGRRAHGVLRTVGSGYLLDIHPDNVDSNRFHQLLTAARNEVDRDDLAAAADLLVRALALWRGPALADIEGNAAEHEANRLEEMRLSAVELRIDVDLRSGRHRQLVSELGALVAANPFRESFTGQLMLALYRSGRQAEALAAYQSTRSLLVEQLGIEPSQPLRELHDRILQQDGELGVAATPPRARPATGNGAGIENVATPARPVWRRTRTAGAALTVGAALVGGFALWPSRGESDDGASSTTSSPASSIVTEFDLAMWPGIGYDLDLTPGQASDTNSGAKPGTPGYRLLDLYRPTVADHIGGVDIEPYDNVEEYNAVASAPDDAAPHYCRRLPVQGGNFKYATADVGTKFCVRTRERHVALLTITQLPASRGDAMQLHVVVIDD